MNAPLVALTLAILAAGPTQTPPPRDQRTAAPPGAAVIAGRIVDAQSGRPIGLATLTAAAPELGSENRTISTNSEGRYELRNLPAGRYSLSVSRTGYLTLRYGQRRPLEQGSVLQLLDRQIADNVDFALPRMSVISGRITDEEGEPVAGALVSAMQMMFFDGGRRPVFAGVGAGNSTDEAGQFRIGGLVPGDYFVTADLRETWPGTEAGVERLFGYSTTYFPGTTNAGARRVTVGLGAEAANTDFSLLPGRSANVSGTVVDSRGRPVANGMISLVQSVGGQEGGRFSRGGDGGAIGDEGRFTIRDVMPGEYTLRVLVRSGIGTPAELAMMPITIDGVDLDVAVTTSNGWTATGQVVTDSGSAGRVPRDRIFISSRATIPGGPSSVSDNPLGPGRVRPDSSFFVDSIFGQARLVVSVPNGWMVKAILHNGLDVAGKPIDTPNGGTLSGVQILLSDALTSISGQLTDEAGASQTAGTVLVFSSDPERWFESSWFVRAVRPDQQGRYEVKGLPAGEYLAVALDYVQDRMWNDPEYLESLRRHAQKVTVGDGESQTVPLKLVMP
jgi:protocatechuate 3,4-dioxygenase beta subunit